MNKPITILTSFALCFTLSQAVAAEREEISEQFNLLLTPPFNLIDTKKTNNTFQLNEEVENISQIKPKWNHQDIVNMKYSPFPEFIEACQIKEQQLSTKATAIKILFNLWKNAWNKDSLSSFSELLTPTIIHNSDNSIQLDIVPIENNWVWVNFIMTF